MLHTHITNMCILWSTLCKLWGGIVLEIPRGFRVNTCSWNISECCISVNTNIECVIIHWVIGGEISGEIWGFRGLVRVSMLGNLVTSTLVFLIPQGTLAAYVYVAHYRLHHFLRLARFIDPIWECNTWSEYTINCMTIMMLVNHSHSLMPWITFDVFFYIV